ncbi:Hsp33 family molecular chaperone HslO [Ferrovibrio sp.]|uniref:Hsp33 family molecular chaperone HslO n=1 Tax=Ferrovibrio sp. TaxID=1917215 RepID=UPI0025B9EFFE|nr:Hsp33 family molecular chaperone HslO [Ferrovibrio sp.]
MSLPDDLSLPFQVEHCDVRGRLVRLGPTVDGVLERHGYPEPVARLLAEAMTLAATMATALKFEGVFSLQAKGDGPVSTLVADCRSGEDGVQPHGLRGYAGFDADRLLGLSIGPGAELVPLLLGKGYLAFTIDPYGEDMERYQGIVDLSGASLADAAHAYFAQSEQLNARVILAAKRRPDRLGRWRWRAGGILVQQLPEQAPGQTTGMDAALTPEDRADAWDRVTALTQTAKADELTSPELSPNDLLYRLFHEDGVRVFEAKPLAPRCTCSAERLAGVLGSFTTEEIAAIVEDGVIAANCQFCNRQYRFDPANLAEISS